mmetsp:Transcript_10322/g.16896  ORF Transcript_10322/g.16896 Transcript_10322/m.16896 type:complete len:530 (-) Transcript_10322:544-2133(-)
MHRNFIALIIFAVILAYISNAEIIAYHDHVVMPDRPEYLVVPKFDQSEVPHWYPGHGRSFIDLSDMKIRSTCDPKAKRPPLPPGHDFTCRDAVFEILMFEAPTDEPWMDYWPNQLYCCTDSVVESGGCAVGNLNKLIVPPNLPNSFLRSTVVKTSGAFSLDDDGLSTNNIKKSGEYVLLMALCDDSAMPVIIDGAVESVDPYGYVPADQFGSMPFNLALSLAYLIVALTWATLCFWYSDQLMPLQMWISAVMFIAMIETTMLYVHFVDWNEEGVPTSTITVVALFFGALKRALSRILIMFVSLGYGVVRPSLGEDMNRVLYLGCSYFVLSFVYSLLVHMSSSTRTVADSDYDMVSLIVFMLAMVDTTFYIWIFSSINNLLTSLASRKQGVKYILYRNFRWVLLVLLVFTGIWVLYSSVIFLNDNGGSNKHWRMKWTVDALWELIYFTIFAAIAVLWAPSKNAQRYAYSIELAQLEEDEEFNNPTAPVTADGADEEGFMDDEYGGRLQDEKDPFQGTGALDPAMAITKKA